MSLPEFNYVAAHSLEDASKFAIERGDKGVFMAGGTDVILLLKDHVLKDVDTVIDIKKIPELDKLEFVEGQGLKVGAHTRLYTIQNSKVVKEKMPALAQAARYVASPQIRRKGTLVGNICNASPSADTASILIVMNATVKTYTKDGGRDIPIKDFFRHVKKTSLEKGEIVTGVFVPELKKGEGSAYFKHSVRKAMDLAIIGVAAWIKTDGKKISDCRICMGGVGITPLRAPKAEKLLVGNEISEELLEEVGVQASKECSPISDVRASAEYRVDMVRVYTKRAIKEALATLA